MDLNFNKKDFQQFLFDNPLAFLVGILFVMWFFGAPFPYVYKKIFVNGNTRYSEKVAEDKCWVSLGKVLRREPIVTGFPDSRLDLYLGEQGKLVDYGCRYTPLTGWTRLSEGYYSGYIQVFTPKEEKGFSEPPRLEKNTVTKSFFVDRKWWR
tara:strand:- start:611 stop:1066 length:456 start_codon:yes stop_codon:yes gene_type:complete